MIFTSALSTEADSMRSNGLSLTITRLRSIMRLTQTWQPLIPRWYVQVTFLQSFVGKVPELTFIDIATALNSRPIDLFEIQGIQ
jgi:hypothetical protein